MQLLSAVWRCRELCGALARKEFFVRFRRTALGALWAVALPALQAAVLTVVVSRIARTPVEDFALYVFAGTVAWAYFSTSLGSGATSIVDNSALSSKIYFPRVLLPLSVCLSNVFGLAISVAILLVAASVTGVLPGRHTLLLVPGVVLAVAFTTALTTVLAAAHVYLRDVKFAVQAALLVWFYGTPIFYALSMIDGTVRTVLELNPLAGVVQLFQAGTLPEASVGLVPVLASVGWTVSLAVAALVLHCRLDRSFADLL